MRHSYCMLIFLTIFTVCIAEVRADDWPQWRGPNRDNVSAETGLLKEWPKEGPPLEWKVEGLGTGIASVSVVDGKIYTLSYSEGSEYIVALDKSSGARLWQEKIGPEIKMNRLMRWLSQRTPTVDDDRLYAVTADGDLVCLSSKDGKQLWRKSYQKQYTARRPGWGFCDFPLIDGEKLICTPGGKTATFVALNKKTGKQIWSSLLEMPQQSAYAAMVALETDGKKIYVNYLRNSLVGISADNGKLLWSYDKTANRTANSYTPIVRGQKIFCANGYGTGIALLDSISTDKKFDVKEVYFQKMFLDPFQDSTAAVGDHVFMFQGSGAPTCVNWKTGEKRWAVRGTGRGKAALTYADGHLYMRHSDGVVSLAEANPKEYVEKGFFHLPGYQRSIGSTFPVVANGRLYIRDDDRLFCYDIRETALEKPRKAPRTIILSKLGAPPKRDRLAQRIKKKGVNRSPDSIYYPTPKDIVLKMLELAKAKKTDVVYDLGSGDGRIVIAAAEKYGCRAVGYELDQELVAVSTEKIKKKKLEKLATIEHKDMFTVDLGKANIVAVYQFSKLLEKLMPQFAKMKPGSTIVSHQFGIPDVIPDEDVTIESNETGDTHRIYVYTIPLKKRAKKD